MYKKLIFLFCALLTFTTEVSAFMDIFTVYGKRYKNIKSHIINNIKQATGTEWIEEGLAYPENGYTEFFFVPENADSIVRQFYYREIDETKLKYKGLDGIWEWVKGNIRIPPDCTHKIISKTENEIVFEVFVPESSYFHKNLIGILFKTGPYTYQEYAYAIIKKTLTQEQKDNWLTLIRNTRINF